MTNCANDNRYILIEKYKKKLIEYTNIEHSKEEMDVLNDILFRLWQLNWLDRLDKFEKIKESYWKWVEKTGRVWGADDDTIEFIKEVVKEIENED